MQTSRQTMTHGQLYNEGSLSDSSHMHFSKHPPSVQGRASLVVDSVPQLYEVCITCSLLGRPPLGERHEGPGVMVRQG